MQTRMITAREVAYKYSTIAGQQPLKALKSAFLDVPEGQFCTIVGKSGCGKTTLLKILAGLLRPTKGEVFLDGRLINQPSRNCAVVFQDYSKSLLPWSSAFGNIKLGLANSQLSKNEKTERAERYLNLVGLSESADKYPWQLSGGMQQRVAIARALAQEPKVLLMDEPFGSLDAPTRFSLEDELLGIVKRFGITVLMITHDVDEAIYLSDRVLVMDQFGILRGDEDGESDECDLSVNLGETREQVRTRSEERFAELRAVIFKKLGLTHEN